MAHAEKLDDERIVVKTSWNEKDLIKQIPGARWDPDDKQWTVPLGWASCVMLRGVFGKALTVGDRLNQAIWATRKQRIDPTLKLREATSGVHVDVKSGDMRLFDYQEADVEFLRVAGSALLGNDMGLGKSVSVAAALHVSKDALPAVIICPNSTKQAWKRHIQNWLPGAEPIVIDGSAAVRKKLLADVPDNAVVIINIEGVRGHSRLTGFGSIRLKKCRSCDKFGDEALTPVKCEVHPKELNKIPFKTVVLDEAHRIKDPNSKQTRAVWAVAQQASVTRRWALTGTPIANNPSDLWSIMHFVARNEFPTKSKYVDRYCLQAWNGWGGTDIVGIRPDTRDEFYKILDPRFRRMPKALVLPQLPPKVWQTRIVQMTPKQLKAYNEIAEGLVTRLDSGEIMIAPSNLAAQIRLIQFASSYVEISEGVIEDETGLHYDLDNLVYRLIDPSPKVDTLEEIHEDMGDRPYVVSAMSRQLIELAARRLDKRGVRYGLITGKQNQWERNEAIRGLRAGELQCVLFTVAAGGTGVDGLQVVDTAIRLQRSWSMVDNKQALDRIHRIGSEVHSSINVIDVITEGTVEETQLARLIEKEARLEEIVRDRQLLTKNGADTSELDRLEQQIVNSNLGAP